MLFWSWCFWELRFPYVGDIGDDGQYVVSAQALRAGEGYVLPSRPGPPSRPKYPMGLPLLLAGLPDPASGHVVVLAAAWMFAAATYVFARRAGTTAAGSALVAAAAVFACLPRTRWIMADLPMSAVAAVLFARWLRPATTLGSAGEGSLVAIAFLLRRPGIGLLPACLLRQGWKSKLAITAAFLAVDFPFELYMLRFPHTLGEEYSAEAFEAGLGAASAAASIVTRNAVDLLSIIPQTAAPFLYSNIARTFAGLLVHAATAGLWVAMAAGVWWFGRKLLAPIWLFCSITVAIVLVWPWPVGQRLTLPIAPVIVLLLGAALYTANRARAAVAAWIVLLFGNAAMSVRAIAAADAVRSHSANLAQVFEAVRTLTETGAVILTQAPEEVYLATGRKAIPMFTAVAELRPGDIAAVQAWIPLVKGSPIYLLGSCVKPPDHIVVQANAIKRQPGYSAREIFRTADCQMTLESLAPAAR
jgi:hypothetical protein